MTRLKVCGCMTAHTRLACCSQATDSAPRKIDPLISLALVCEMDHDYPGALAALNEQLSISQQEWHILGGESIDEILREIERIKKLA